MLRAQQNGTLKDAFGTGTAATIAPIASIGFQGTDYELPGVETREFSNRVSKELDLIRTGKMADPFNWVYKVG